MAKSKPQLPSLEKRKKKFFILYDNDPNKSEVEFWNVFDDYISRFGYECEEFVFNEGCLSWGELIDADFTRAKFKGDTTDFNEVSFKGKTKFTRTEFSGKTTNFYNAIFKSVDFYHARFEAEKTNFFKSKFHGSETDFSNSVFKGESVSFVSTVFTSIETTFSWSDFGAKNTSFSGAKFMGEDSNLDFSWAEFGGANTYFRKAEFAGRSANFYGADFSGSGRVDFSYIQSATTIEFSGKTESGQAKFVFANAKKVDFSNIHWTKNGATFRFVQADLSHVSFLDTDTRNIEFTSVKWSKSGKGITLVGERIDFPKYRQIKRYSARKELPHGKLERVYRDLKLNHENAKDFPTAGDFHYREKEMRRLKKNTKPYNKFILTLYKWFSGYGERMLRPAFWIVVTIVLGAMFFTRHGLSYANDVETVHNFKESLVYSIKNTFFLRPRDPSPYSLRGEVVRVAQTLLGPFFLGLFGLSLRQRVKR